jgi:hypothetical protein
MRLSTTLIIALSAFATLNTIAKFQQTNGHSWIACTDYRGDASKWTPSGCKAWPRGFFAMRGDNNKFGEQR